MARRTLPMPDALRGKLKDKALFVAHDNDGTLILSRYVRSGHFIREFTRLSPDDQHALRLILGKGDDADQ